MVRRAAAASIGMLLFAAVAYAQAPAPAPLPAPEPAPAAPPEAGGDGRYTFNRVQDGYIRLDTRTGQVAMCSRRTVGWACQALPDDRLVLESEIARLQGENAALKKELLSRGLGLPSGVRPEAPVGKSEDTSRSTGSPDVDRVLSAIEKVWRRLVEMIVNLQRDVMKKS